jgi:hypothetical protein
MANFHPLYEQVAPHMGWDDADLKCWINDGRRGDLLPKDWDIWISHLQTLPNKWNDYWVSLSKEGNRPNPP